MKQKTKDNILGYLLGISFGMIIFFIGYGIHSLFNYKPTPLEITTTFPKDWTILVNQDKTEYKFETSQGYISLFTETTYEKAVESAINHHNNRVKESKSTWTVIENKTK